MTIWLRPSPLIPVLFQQTVAIDTPLPLHSSRICSCPHSKSGPASVDLDHLISCQSGEQFKATGARNPIESSNGQERPASMDNNCLKRSDKSNTPRSEFYSIPVILVWCCRRGRCRAQCPTCISIRLRHEWASHPALVPTLMHRPRGPAPCPPCDVDSDCPTRAACCS
ncbi:hypothetical protein NEOLEDRAFT_102918 [Neolentinus lepideus HHB14362 ss-1]|uniref:Uncharacterized protein n=1 Tax=Neolentinus lepideus HHB14362 ss-1 TaxID=1314782 RepID=A0A165U3V3_9AGAM|nr:hypothetical protein NEOLEDRAFT_102918 [Neolentinus lepideus HHB14362 ss-1]